MDFSILEQYNFTELKNIARKMNIIHTNSKQGTLDIIKKALLEYELYKNDIESKYIIGKQLGEPGKDGTTYLVTNKEGIEYAMKTFKKQKSSDLIRKEATLQQQAADCGVAPNVIEVDTISKFIVMDKLDKNLIDVMKKQNGNLTPQQQQQIVRIFQKLDTALVFQGDSNPINYMLKGKKIYLIDYGFAKEINSKLIKKLKTDTPNIKIMLLGFILKLKELNCPSTSYDFLITFLSEDDIEMYNIKNNGVGITTGNLT